MKIRSIVLLIVSMVLVFSFSVCAFATGIIGSADGPTAIIVSGNSTALFVALAIAVAALIVALYCIIKRRNKN